MTLEYLDIKRAIESTKDEMDTMQKMTAINSIVLKALETELKNHKKPDDSSTTSG